MSTDPATPTPTAYSYVRFSTPEQAAGDSLRRQTQAAEEWCKRKGVHLDQTLRLSDLGKSAYRGAHRTNPDRYALAAFLKLIEEGKITRGSYLIVENLDRLTREHVRAAVTLFLSILEHGVNIVTTSPERVFNHDSQDMTDIIIAVVEFSRGHQESNRKETLVGEAWANKRDNVRNGREQRPTKWMGPGARILTRKLPAWVEAHGGALRLIPERAETIRLIFRLCRDGYGARQIINHLHANKIPPFTSTSGTVLSGRWNPSYVRLILANRQVRGELQLCSGKIRKPEGDPIPGYFPELVTEEEFQAAQAVVAARTRRGDLRERKHINLFGGLLFDARDGGRYLYNHRNVRGGHTSLVNANSIKVRAPARLFPADVFDRAALSRLTRQQIDPHEILNGDHGPDETLALSGELARVEARVAEIEAELEEGDVAALARVLRKLEARKKELIELLAAARQKAATPLSEAWGETQSLLDVIDTAGDDVRVRLRSALRRIIDGVQLLVFKRGFVTLAVFQVWFKAGHRSVRRDYVIRHRRYNVRANKPPEWSVESAADLAAALDLRLPEHAARLAAALERLDLD